MAVRIFAAKALRQVREERVDARMIEHPEPGVTVKGSTRSVVTYGLALGAGAALFFLIFAAVFNGIWPLLILFLLGYAVAGFLGARMGGVSPSPLTMSLSLPSVPWVLWLFPASIPEAGFLRALWWPGLALAAYLLAWLGGIIGMRSRSVASSKRSGT